MDDNKKLINADIRTALERSLTAWDQLAKECVGPSVEEQRLLEMKSLLKDLQRKLEELSL